MGLTTKLTRFRVALCQCQSVQGDYNFDPRPDNLEKAIKKIKEAASGGAKLAVFGECYLQGYFSYEHFTKCATTINPPDDHIIRLVQSCKENNIFVIMGMVTRTQNFPEGLFNSSILLGPEGIVGSYSKVHLPSWVGTGPGGAKISVIEKSCYNPGVEIPVFDSVLGKVGIQICYDIWFPEVTRVQTLKGAQLIVISSASVSPFEENWDVLMRARAMENQAWTVMGSVVGKSEDGQNLFGGSRIIDPTGKELARARDNVEEVVIAEVDYGIARELREKSHYFYDRNPKLYDEITKALGRS